MAGCPTCGRGMSKEDKEEFDKGYDDGVNGRPSRPTSLMYVRGYEKGREVREIGK